MAPSSEATRHPEPEEPDFLDGVAGSAVAGRVPDAMRFPLGDHIGLVIEVREPGRVRASVEVGPHLYNPHGVLHGGVVFLMVDTAMGTALTSTLDTDQSCATIDLGMHFLRPVVAGRIEADTRVLHRRDDVVHLRSEVTDAEGRTVATATGAFAVVPLSEVDRSGTTGHRPQEPGS